MNRKSPIAGLRLAAPLLLAVAGCLSVLDAGTQDDGGAGTTTGAGNGTSGSGTSGSVNGTSGVQGSSSSGPGSASSGSSGGASTGGSTTGNPGCTYPVAAADGLTQFPDATLGDGWVNFSGATDSSGTIGLESDALLQLHCSGKRYALIPVLTGWDVHSQQFAQDQATDQDVAGWLKSGGVVFAVLEQDANQQPATQMDLTNWASQYQITYSLLGDPSEDLATALVVRAWPTLYVVRLSDMGIVYSVQEGVASIGTTFSSILADGGSP